MCSCVPGAGVCTCTLPDNLDLMDFWIVGTAAVARWGAELIECEQIRKAR